MTVPEGTAHLDVIFFYYSVTVVQQLRAFVKLIHESNGRRKRANSLTVPILPVRDLRVGGLRLQLLPNRSV
jgi:hypothetical protein